MGSPCLLLTFLVMNTSFESGIILVVRKEGTLESDHAIWLHTQIRVSSTDNLAGVLEG